MKPRTKLFFRDAPADAEQGEVMLALPPGAYSIVPGPSGNSMLVIRRRGSDNRGRVDQAPLLPFAAAGNSGNSQDAAPVLTSTPSAMRHRQAGAEDACTRAAKELARTGDSAGRPVRHSPDAIAAGAKAAQQARTTAGRLRAINEAHRVKYRLPR